MQSIIRSRRSSMAVAAVALPTSVPPPSRRPSVVHSLSYVLDGSDGRGRSRAGVVSFHRNASYDTRASWSNARVLGFSQQQAGSGGGSHSQHRR